MKEIKITRIKIEEALGQIDAITELGLKERGCLRLLTEEMYSMCQELLDIRVLNFQIRQVGRQYSLSVSTKARVDKAVREQLLLVSSSGKNAANKGVKGMLGAVLELFFMEGSPELANSTWIYGMHTQSYSDFYLWTLSRYMEKIEAQDAKSQWDELEKSIIANFADDVSIGVCSGRLEMTVTKNFYFGGNKNDD